MIKRDDFIKNKRAYGQINRAEAYRVGIKYAGDEFGKRTLRLLMATCARAAVQILKGKL
jgi:hypothetical protein